jgi:tRNA pseudouridine32 synthase/23S rRNA pseudouridine746 synthase
VVGLTPAAQRGLSAQFEARTVEKRYVALVDGIVEHPAVVRGEELTIEFPIRPDLENRPWQIHDPVHGRRAVTRLRLLAYEIDRTRLELKPVTGRAHQLRVHCAFARPLGLGHPILGDVLYGPTPKVAAGGAARLMLHAAYLEFADPVTGARVAFESRTPF